MLQNSDVRDESQTLLSKASTNNFFLNLIKVSDGEGYHLSASMIIVGAITFVGDSSRGILFPVLWDLCRRLNGSIIDLGYIVAMFSIGRLIVTTPLGYLSDRYRQRFPLVLSSGTLVLGAALWANSYPTHSIATLYISQFILGCGSGSLGVTRSYVVEQSDPHSRTQNLAYMTALQYAGFTVSPILGSFLGYIGSTISPYWMFALPGYSIWLLALYCFVSLLAAFMDSDPKSVELNVVVNSSSSLTSLPSGYNNAPTVRNEREYPPIDGNVQLANTAYQIKFDSKSNENDSTVISPFHTDAESRNSNQTSIIAAVIKDTSQPTFTGSSKVPKSITELSSPPCAAACIVAMILLNVSTKGSISVYETLGAQIAVNDYNMTIFNVGVLITSCGAFGFIQLLMFKSFWTKYFTDMQLMFGGIFVMIVAQLIALSYAETPNFTRFIMSFVLMYAIGYPIGHTAVLGAFSKIQKSGTHGSLQGWFASAGSLARIIIPIITGYLDTAVDNAPFGMVLILLTISYGSLILFRPALQGLIESRPDPQFNGDLKVVWRCLTKWEKIQFGLMFGLLIFAIIALVDLSVGAGKGVGLDESSADWGTDTRGRGR